MNLSIVKEEIIKNIADIVERFLPANPHPFGDQSLSFPAIANEYKLGGLFHTGNKRTKITNFLLKAYEYYNNDFWKIILEIVKRGRRHQTGSKPPITREEIKDLNQVFLKLKIKIPDLWDKDFLEKLPTNSKNNDNENLKNLGLTAEIKTKFKNMFLEICAIKSPQQRGFAFEKFLKELFAVNNLNPNGSFKIQGEQIDGSFELKGETYLIEAKWEQGQANGQKLIEFHSKIESRAWARGLFISFNGFTSDAHEIYLRGRKPNLITLDSSEIFHILDENQNLKGLTLYDVLIQKVRVLNEKNEFILAQEL